LIDRLSDQGTKYKTDIDDLDKFEDLDKFQMSRFIFGPPFYTQPGRARPAVRSGGLRSPMTHWNDYKACGMSSLRERLILKLAVLAGVRPGEIFGLRRGDIGEAQANVCQHVYRAISTHQKRINQRGRLDCRKVYGRIWLRWSRHQVPYPMVCSPFRNVKTPLAKDNVWRRHIPPKLKEIGLDWVNFRVLRRSHASLMRDQDIDPKVVADQQGPTLDVNLNVYTQTTLESRIEAVQQLESALVH
jgi:integrase